MDPATFDSAESFLDEITEIADRQLGVSELHRLLSDLSKTLGKRYTVSVNLTVDVFDQDQLRSLPLLNTGLATSEGKEPYRIWGDSSPQRYVVENGIQVVPHDRCRIVQRGLSTTDENWGANGAWTDRKKTASTDWLDRAALEYEPQSGDVY